MNELSDYTSPVIEFTASNAREKQFKLIESSTATDPLPLKIDASVETYTKSSQGTQTEKYQVLDKNIDERKLADWLQRIYATVEKELLKGCTPVLKSLPYESLSHEIQIQPYQKLSIQSATNSSGLATWLSVYANNAPVLVVTTVASHDDWCEHIDQYLNIFVPKRVPNGNFVTYTEAKSIPIKACLKCLCTNPTNKDIFAGSSFDGDIYIWQYERQYRNDISNKDNVDIKEIFHMSLPHGYAVAMDWSSDLTLLTAHTDSSVVQWRLAKNMIKEAEYLIKPSPNASAEICSLLALSLNSFVVGDKYGSVLHCAITNLPSAKRHLEIIALKKHSFMTSTLLCAHINGHKNVISCDLSGQVYFHDLRNLNDDTDTNVTEIPLPFKNTIACSRDGSVIYSPGNDGSLECYRIDTGLQSTIKGALKGKGNFIRSSDNGCWLVTGLYENEFQIFSVED